jgi:hypothetical protein
MKRFPHKHIRWERVAHCFFSTEGLARAGLLGWAALLKEAKWLGVRLSQAQATGNFYFAVDQYLRIKSAPVSSAAPALGRAPRACVTGPVEHAPLGCTGERLPPLRRPARLSKTVSDEATVIYW